MHKTICFHRRESLYSLVKALPVQGLDDSVVALCRACLGPMRSSGNSRSTKRICKHENTKKHETTRKHIILKAQKSRTNTNKLKTIQFEKLCFPVVFRCFVFRCFSGFVVCVKERAPFNSAWTSRTLHTLAGLFGVLQNSLESN